MTLKLSHPKSTTLSYFFYWLKIILSSNFVAPATLLEACITELQACPHIVQTKETRCQIRYTIDNFINIYIFFSTCYTRVENEVKQN